LRKAEGHKLPLSQVDRIVADVCRGLQFAHGLNIVHADLKPANVFITTSGNATGHWRRWRGNCLRRQLEQRIVTRG
jgi:serine/threonine protein kinase